VVSELVDRGVEVVATERPGGLRGRSATANGQWISFDIADAPENASAELQKPGVLLRLAWGRKVARRLADFAMNPSDPRPINICSGQTISVRRVVEIWIEENGWGIEPCYGKLPYPGYELVVFGNLVDVPPCSSLCSRPRLSWWIAALCNS
jgi:hypothetical protein